jgi:hypothetical protein
VEIGSDDPGFVLYEISRVFLQGVFQNICHKILASNRKAK